MQSIIDKNNKLNTAFSLGSKVFIELGPGNIRSVKNAITIDKYNSDAVDIIADFEEGLSFLPENSIDYLYSSHVMEHIQNFEFLLREIYRVLKKGATSEFIVPHFANPYFYSDHTHKKFFGLYTMSYFSKTSYFNRKVPNFYNDLNFEIVKVRLEFTSPFILRYPFKKFWQFIFNLSKGMQEFYEEVFCYKIPAYQIRYIIKK